MKPRVLIATGRYRIVMGRHSHWCPWFTIEQRNGRNATGAWQWEPVVVAPPEEAGTKLEAQRKFLDVIDQIGRTLHRREVRARELRRRRGGSA